MAAVPVTISGILADKYGRTIQAVTLFGEMIRSDVSVGGGPIIPPEGEKPPGEGTGIWGPTDPRPTPPIANVPGVGPNPDPPGKPEEPIEPPVQWKAVWHPTEGWIVVGVINPDVPHPVPSA